MTTRRAAVALLAASSLGCAAGVVAGEPGPGALTEVASFPHDRPTGVVVARERRIFVTFPYGPYSDDRHHEVSVAELMPDGSIRPYPDATWNPPAREIARLVAAGEQGRRFLCTQSATSDADGRRLWVLDNGSPRRAGVVPGGAKLVAIDLATDEVERVIPFHDGVVRGEAFLNDVRIDAARGAAYVTDTGTAGLVVVEIATGAQRRVLGAGTDWVAVEARGPEVGGISAPEHARRRFPPSADGIALHSAADLVYLATLPWLGRTLYRVPGAALRDAGLPDTELARRIERVAAVAYSDGIEVDGRGRLYLTDLERGAIVRLEPGSGRLETLAQDPRLSWPDAVALAPGGERLYVPVTRFHEAFAAGREERPFPLYAVGLPSDG